MVDCSLPHVFFDGAAQDNQCGADAVLYISSVHHFHLSFAASYGTNTRAELIALWILLCFAHSREVHSLWIFGDSKCIIDRASQGTHLNEPQLKH